MKLEVLNERLSFVRSGIKEERRDKRFQDALDKLEQYKEAGELFQVEFKEMKEDLSRAIEAAWSELIRAPYFHAGRWENLPEDVYPVGDLNTGLHLVSSSLKKAKKLPDHPSTRAAVKFFTELLPVERDVKALKGMIVKKKKAKVEAEKKKEEKFQKHVASEDVKKVKRVLKRVTTKLRSEIQDDNLKWLKDIVSKWKKQYDPENEKTGPHEFYRNNSHNASIVMRVVERDSYYSPFKMKKGYTKDLEKEATQMTDDMVENFIGKNTSKLAEIVSEKGGLKTVTLRRAWTGRGKIEGTLKLEFKDGSSFVVDSNLVQSYSVRGKPFVRYPTTFHNVIMPNGKKMKGKASESRMKKEFVTGQYYS